MGAGWAKRRPHDLSFAASMPSAPPERRVGCPCKVGAQEAEGHRSLGFRVEVIH